MASAAEIKELERRLAQAESALRDERAREAGWRDSEERLRLAIEVGRLASWDWDMVTGAVNWNDRHYLLQGYEVGEITPSFEAWLARVHPGDRAEAVARIERARNDRSVYVHEFRTLHPDGTIRWCAARGQFFYDADGAPRRMVGVMEDVTDARETADALRRREADLARVQRIGRVGGLDIDVAHGMRSQRSPEYLRLHGLPPDGRTETHDEWRARVHPEDRDAAERALLAALESGETSYDNEYRIVRANDGAVRWIHARADIERDAEGKAIRLVGAHLDITDQKRMQDTVRASEERQVFLLKLSDALRSLSDPSRIERMASQLLVEHLGVDRVICRSLSGDDASPAPARIDATDLASGFPETLLKAHRTLVVSEARADVRLGHAMRDAWGRMDIGAAIVVPLMKNGGMIAMFGVHDATRRDWTAAEVALVEDVADRSWAAIERGRAETRLRESESRLQLLIAELQHRVRNILTVVRSVFGRSFDGAEDLEEAVDHFRGRLDALARTQVIVTQTATGTVDLEALIRDELLSVGVGDGPDVTIGGPDVALSARQAEMIGLAIHELITNALKYGALKVQGGRLTINWTTNINQHGRETLALSWSEQGVPAIGVEPNREGFGLELIEQALPYRLGAETKFEFRGGGISCTISVPLNNSGATAPPPGEPMDDEQSSG